MRKGMFGPEVCDRRTGFDYCQLFAFPFARNRHGIAKAFCISLRGSEPGRSVGNIKSRVPDIFPYGIPLSWSPP